MKIDHWRKIPVPLGFVAALMLAAWLVMECANRNLAFARDLRRLEQKVDVRFLSGEKRQLEQEIMKLQVKKSVKPRDFDTMDSIMLKKYEDDLKDVKSELQQVKEEP